MSSASPSPPRPRSRRLTDGGQLLKGGVSSRAGTEGGNGRDAGRARQLRAAARWPKVRARVEEMSRWIQSGLGTPDDPPARAFAKTARHGRGRKSAGSGRQSNQAPGRPLAAASILETGILPAGHRKATIRADLDAVPPSAGEVVMDRRWPRPLRLIFFADGRHALYPSRNHVSRPAAAPDVRL